MAIKLPQRRPAHTVHSTHAAHTGTHAHAHAHHVHHHVHKPAVNIMDYAPNNADPNDDRGFRGAQQLREQEEEKRRIAHSMRMELRRRALLEAIRTGKVRLPQRK